MLSQKVFILKNILANSSGYESEIIGIRDKRDIT